MYKLILVRAYSLCIFIIEKVVHDSQRGWSLIDARIGYLVDISWWRLQMETFSALLVLCARNSPVTGEFPSQRPVTRSFGVFFDLHLNKRLSKQSWDWWFETPLWSLWRHCNAGLEWQYNNNHTGHKHPAHRKLSTDKHRFSDPLLRHQLISVLCWVTYPCPNSTAVPVKVIYHHWKSLLYLYDVELHGGHTKLYQSFQPI